MRSIAFLAAVTTLGAAPAAQAALKVVTTTTDLADVTRKIGGDRVEVDSICRGDQDPHFVEPRPSYMVDLSHADLLVSVGLDLEIGWLPSLLQGARNPDINPGGPGFLDASTAIHPIEIPHGAVDRSQGDIHPRGNPHYWLDPQNVKAIAQLVGDRLARLDPDGAAGYHSRTQAYVRRLDAKMVAWRTALQPLAGTKVVTYHRTFNYFLARFGLTPTEYIEPRPGIPPSAAHLAEVIHTMQDGGVKLVLHENFYERRASEMVASRANARLLVLPTSVGGERGAGSYVALIDHLVAALTAE